MRTPFSAAALFTLTVGMTATAVAAAAEPGSLPALNLGPWQIGAQATRYNTEDESHRIDARLVHSSRYRQQFGVDAGWLVGERWAAGFNLAAGRTGDFRDLVGNLVHSPVEGWHGRLSLGRLQSTDAYSFASGPADVRVQQDAWLAGLVRDGPAQGLWGDARWTMYGARARVPALAPVVIQSRTGAILQASTDVRRLSAGQMLGTDLAVGLFPVSDARLDLALGRERTRFPMADGTDAGSTRLVGRLGWLQDLDGCRRVGLNLASTTASRTLGLVWESGQWQLGLSRSVQQPQPAETRLSLGWRVPVGGSATAGAPSLAGCARTPLRAQAGEFARGLVAGDAVGQAAQVLHQHHAQRGGQRPQLALAEFALVLVGVEETLQQRGVEGAVGVGHKGPGHAVNARQAHQGRVLQHRQAGVIARRQAFVNFSELVFDQVKVVQQPFGGRAELLAVVGLSGDVAKRGAQCADVALQTRVKRGAPKGGLAGPLRQGQAAPMLFQAGRAHNFSPDGLQRETLSRIQHALDLLRNPSPAATQQMSRHALQRHHGSANQQREHQGGGDETARHQAAQ